MASKRKTKKKKTTKKTEPAPIPSETTPALTPPQPGKARRVEGLPFWKYKAQLMTDRNIGLRDVILRLRQDAVDQRGKMSTLTKLISELEQQLADKEGEIVEYEKKFLDADRAGVQQGNAAITAELQINNQTHNIKIMGDVLIIEPKPKEFRDK